MERRRLLAVIGSVALALAFATPAQAAQLFASPDGAGGPCNPTPCSLTFAITGAGNGDEVIVKAGTYSVNAAIPSTASDLSVHGDTSGPMPVIAGTVGGSNVPIYLQGINTHLSYLDITNTADASFAAVCYSGTVDRVRLTAIGTNSIGLLQNECTVRDSLVRAIGTGTTAWSASSPVNGKSGVGRNVTAIATGQNSVGLVVAYLDFLPGSYTLTASNLILDGAVDAKSDTTGAGPGKLLISNSNFDTSIGTAITPTAIQTAAPIFVNAAAGDYREAAGSPTIDAGSSDGIGPLDLDGNARSQGAAPDVGAFEATPQPTPAQPAAQVQSLALGAKRFRAANIGGSIARKKAPVGTTVSYQLTGAATTSFTVDRALKGAASPARSAASRPARTVSARSAPCSRRSRVASATPAPSAPTASSSPAGSATGRSGPATTAWSRTPAARSRTPPSRSFAERSVALTPAVERWRSEGEYADFRDRRIFVHQREGDGPLLLLLHGFPTCCFDWRGVLDRTSGPALTFDFLGFGLSDKPDDHVYTLAWQADIVEELVSRHAGDREIVLVAHDMGTSVTTELLARDLEGKLSFKPAKVLLFNGSMILDRATLTLGQKLLRSRARSAGLQAREQARLQMATRRRVLRVASAHRHRRRRPLVAPDLQRRAEDRHKLVYYLEERERFIERWHGAIRDWPGDLSLTWGLKDPVANTNVLAGLRELRPGVAVTELPQLGHYPQLEDPDAIVAVIEPLLASAQMA